MKQTNNAIKFLMAQYRAIFKNAYFKGMASAVLLTAGLAVAGGAQATDYDQDDFGTITSDNWAAADTIQITDGVVGGSIENNNAFNITITSTGNKIDASSATNVPVTVNALSGSITLADSVDGADFLIKATDGSGATFNIKSFTVGDSGALTISGSSATGVATLNAGTITLAGGTSSSIKFSGSAAAAAVLQGHLTSTATVGSNGDTTKLTTLDFSQGSGTLKTYGTGVNANINVYSQKGAVLDLSLEDPENETAENQLLQLTGGKIDLQGHDSNSGATFTIAHGTLEIGDDVVLTNSTGSTKAGQLIVSGAAATDNATLRISSEKLKSFLAADGQSPDKSGAVTVNSGSIYLTDSTKSAVDLADGFTFATSAVEAGGSIALTTTADSIIAGDKLAVSKKLTGDASKATIEATTLTLGSETFNSATDDAFGFASATTQSLNLVQSGSGAFVLKDAITLKAATQEVDNIYTTNVSGDKITIAGNGGNIANTDLKLNGGSTDALTIAAGHYTGNVDVEISSGSLSVGLGATNAESQGVKGVDASLTFAAGTTLTLDNKTNTNTITVQGNGDATWDGVTEQRTATSTLDLRQANIVFASDGVKNPGSSYQKLTTFNINEGGELLVTEDQMNYLLNNIHDARDTSAISGAAIVLSGSATGDGAVIVDGDLEVAADTLKSGTGTANDTIYFNGGGILQADSLTITDDPADPTKPTEDTDPTVLDIGSGKLVAETIALNSNIFKADASGLQENFTVKDGDLFVGSSLTSVNSNVVLGDGTSGASLTLGYISKNYDQYGIALPETEENAYTLSADTGTVQPNLVLSGGTTGQESALNVEYGDWTIQDLTATNATIKVGQSDEGDDLQKHDINGNVYTTSLTGQGLTLNGGVNMHVYDNATAKFETLALNGGDVTVENTTLTINGKYVAPVEDNPATTDKDETVAESWGLKTTTGTIKVSGREGQLILGADAVKGISTTKNADGVYEYTNKNAAQNAFVTLDNWATLSLALGSSVTFDKTSLQELRKDFISGNTGNVLTQGFINIGEAQIAGINTSTGTISWNGQNGAPGLKDYSDIIADILQNGLTSATLIDVTASDTVQANVGNILADGSTPIVKLGDTTLHQANADGNFIANENGTEVDALVTQGAHFAVYNGGKLNDVTLQGGSSTSTTEFAVIASATEGAEEPETTIKSVTSAASNTSFNVAGKTTVTGNVDVGEVVLSKDLTVNGKTYISEGLNSDEDASGNLVTTGTLTTNDTLEVLGGADFAGNIVANSTATFGKADISDDGYEYYFAGNNTFKNVTLNNGAEFDKGVTTAETMTIGDGMEIYGGASVKANVLQFTTAAPVRMRPLVKSGRVLTAT